MTITWKEEDLCGLLSVLFVFPLINFLLGDDHSPLTIMLAEANSQLQNKNNVRHCLVKLSKLSICSGSLGLVTKLTMTRQVGTSPHSGKSWVRLPTS